MRSFVAFAALAGSAAASPLLPRQQGTTTVPDSGSAAQTTAASTTSLDSASATDSAAVSSSVSSITSALSSLASSAASNTSSAPAPTATSATNTSSPEFLFGCPDGYSLSYVLGIAQYPAVNISTAYNATEDWNVALPPPIALVNNSGAGPGQAMRTWSLENLTVSEVLVNQTDNATIGYTNQVWNLTAPLTLAPSVIISNATSDLTLYTNSTNNETTVQLFVNFCVSDQQAGLTAYSEIVSLYLTGLNTLYTNGTASGSNSTSTGGVGGATSSAASATSDASSSIASATSDASSSVASATSDASNRVSGGVDTATSDAAGVGTTAISGASSVASTAVAGATSVASVASEGLSSLATAAAGVVTRF